jgi:KUP system potassium uptake protein
MIANIVQNLTVHDASVLKAFSPYFAGAYLVRNKTDGWKSLGGILLAFTGVEALFADLGAFTRRAVQLSWMCFAFPCLLLAYIGQAAYISDTPSAWSNPFFASVPPGTFWPSLIIAILAAVVASQAMITGVFQLLSQIMKLSYFPQIKLVHTSKIFYGQIYIPLANWLLMIGTIVVTAAYSNTTRLGDAYGVCVVMVTFITTCMVGIVALIIWHIPAPIVLVVWLIFACLDGVYLSSALTKVPQGAWFTLALAVILSSIFILWRFGKEQQWRAETSDRFPPSHLLMEDSEKSNNRGLKLTPAFGGHPVTRIHGLGIFFDKSGAPSTTPTVFIHFLQKFHAAPDVVVFFHLRPVTSPTIPVDERYKVSRCFTGAPGERRFAIPNCYRLVIRHGYNDEVITHDLGMLVFEQLRNYVIREASEPAMRNAVVETHEDTPDTSNTSTTESAPGQPVARITFHNGPKNTVTTSDPPKAFAEQEKGFGAPRSSFDQTSVSEKLADLQHAYDNQVVYVVGKEQLRISPQTSIVRSVLLAAYVWMRENTRSKVQALNVEVDKLVEVGFVKEMH